MEQNNDCLRIAIHQGKAYCKLFAAKDGGARLDIKEAEHYLFVAGIYNYDKTEFRSFIQAGNEGVLYLGPYSFPAFSAILETTIAEDDMTCFGKVYPPSLNGSELSRADIVNGLKKVGVRYGIQDDTIEEFLKKPVYFTDIPFALGEREVEGKDASIEYHFNANPSRRPNLNEDGSVDYHDLEIMNPIAKGDLLATLYPADLGQIGSDVFGHKLHPLPVKQLMLSYGRDIQLDEDRVHIYSDVDGYVRLNQGKVEVSKVYLVSGDVDTSTGDIKFPGSVHVKGSVRGGFRIECDGNIEVDGVVEDATLVSGGDIIVKHGIQGRHKGNIRAQGNLICKFIESGNATVGGYVEAGSLIMSEVSAEGDINIEEKKGSITGGKLRSGGNICAQVIGSDVETATRVEIGPDFETKKRYKELEGILSSASKTIEESVPELQKMKLSIERGNRMEGKQAIYFRKLMTAVEEAQEIIHANEAEYQECQTKMAASEMARVSVARTIYPGTTIVLGALSITLRKKYSHIYFSNVGGEIKPQLL